MENYIAPVLAPHLFTARSWRNALKSFVPEPEIKKRTMVASSISSESPGCVVRLAFSVVRHCLCNHAGLDYKDWLSEWKLVLTVPGCAGVYFIPLCAPCVYSCVLWWKNTVRSWSRIFITEGSDYMCFVHKGHLTHIPHMYNCFSTLKKCIEGFCTTLDHPARLEASSWLIYPIRLTGLG